MRFGRRRRREAQPFPVYAPGETRPAPAPSGHVRVVQSALAEGPTQIVAVIWIEGTIRCTKLLFSAPPFPMVPAGVHEVTFAEPVLLEKSGWYLIRYDPAADLPPEIEGPVDQEQMLRASAQVERLWPVPRGTSAAALLGERL